MQFKQEFVWRSKVLIPNHSLICTCRNALLAGVVSVLLAGCGKQEADQGGAPKGQVIAHVGKDDVTIQELENESRWAQIPPDRRDDATVKRMLGDLIQRKYLVQKAIAAKLDREPSVLLNMLRAREQVLASAFVQRDVSSKSTAIGKADTDKYINSHPLMFGKRQLLTVDKVSIPLTPDTRAAVEATKNLKSLEEIELKLTEVGMLHNRSMGVISSSDVSEEFYNALKNQKPDDVFFIPSGSAGAFFKVKGQEARPITGDEAAAFARQQLLRELLRSETDKQAVSAETDVKYEGDYARIMRGEPKAETKGREKDKAGK
jgi:EpsD family peptidyl-prolyl cis-trans isomerase